MEEYKGITDLLEEHLSISQKLRNAQASKEDISELQINIFK